MLSSFNLWQNLARDLTRIATHPLKVDLHSSEPSSTNSHDRYESASSFFEFELFFLNIGGVWPGSNTANFLSGFLPYSNQIRVFERKRSIELTRDHLDSEASDDNFSVLASSVCKRGESIWFFFGALALSDVSQTPLISSYLSTANHRFFCS